MKKLFMSVALFVCALMFMPNVSAATEFTFDGWKADTGYGSKTKVNDYITNLKGETTAVGGMFVGPFNNQSTQKLADGIVEDVLVDLDFSTVEVAEYFEVSLGLKGADGNYLDEAVVMTQLVEEGKFKLTAGWAPDFEAVVTKDGVYAYQWEVYKEGQKAYVKFNLVKNGEVVETTGAIEFSKLNAEGVSVRYLWFCNVNVAEGVNVYTRLPKLTVDTDTKSDFITVVDPVKAGVILENAVRNDEFLEYFVERFDALMMVVPHEFSDEDMEDATDEELALFEDAVKDDKIAKYFSNMVGVGDEEGSDILFDYVEKIEYNLVLPEDLPAVAKGYERKYHLIEMFLDETNPDDEYGINVLEPTLSKDGKTLTFATNKSGVYALSYVDSLLPPQTGDISIFNIILTVAIASVVGYFAIISLRKRVASM